MVRQRKECNISENYWRTWEWICISAEMLICRTPIQEEYLLTRGSSWTESITGWVLLPLRSARPSEIVHLKCFPNSTVYLNQVWILSWHLVDCSLIMDTKVLVLPKKWTLWVGTSKYCPDRYLDLITHIYLTQCTDVQNPCHGDGKICVNWSVTI